MATEFPSKCNILAEIWLNHRNDENYEDFVEYNDLGLPLAFALSQEIIEVSEKAKSFIEEAFDLLLETIDINDEGFSSFADMLKAKST
jgi:hypothetical protein